MEGATTSASCLELDQFRPAETERGQPRTAGKHPDVDMDNSEVVEES